MLIFGFKEGGQAVTQLPVLQLLNRLFITEVFVKASVKKNGSFFQTVEYVGFEAGTRNNIFEVSQTYCKVKGS